MTNFYDIFFLEEVIVDQVNIHIKWKYPAKSEQK